MTCEYCSKKRKNLMIVGNDKNEQMRLNKKDNQYFFKIYVATYDLLNHWEVRNTVQIHYCPFCGRKLDGKK